MKKDYTKSTIERLKASLKGQAYLVTQQNGAMATKDDKVAELEAIAKLSRYIDNFEANKQKLAEYADYQARIEDDGR